MSTFTAAVYEAIARRNQWMLPAVIGFNGQNYEAFPQANASAYPAFLTILELDADTLAEWDQWSDTDEAGFEAQMMETERDLLNRAA